MTQQKIRLAGDNRHINQRPTDMVQDVCRYQYVVQMKLKGKNKMIGYSEKAKPHDWEELWLSKIVYPGTPEQHAELDKAHQHLDIQYHADSKADFRILRVRKLVQIQVEVVPAMWEEPSNA